MSASDATTAGSPRLLESAREVAGAVLALGCTRLQLATTEVEEERLRLSELAFWAVGSLFCFGVGLVLAALLAVLIAWNGPRELVLATLALLFLGAGAWSALTLRRKSRDKPPFMTSTLTELRRDAAALGGSRR